MFVLITAGMGNRAKTIRSLWATIGSDGGGLLFGVGFGRGGPAGVVLGVFALDVDSVFDIAVFLLRVIIRSWRWSSGMAVYISHKLIFACFEKDNFFINVRS